VALTIQTFADEVLGSQSTGTPAVLSKALCVFFSPSRNMWHCIWIRPRPIPSKSSPSIKLYF
jgi:hypothetical protein